MEPTDQPIHLTPHRTRRQETACPADLQRECSLPISELPSLVQPEATKFLRFVDKVLDRLTSIVRELCDGYLEELRLCLQNYDRLASYHVDLLARRIGKEVEALYQGLRVSTIEHIELWVERQSLKTSEEEHQEISSIR